MSKSIQKKTIKWQHGKESDYKLCIYAGERWLAFYSVDVQDKYKTKSELGNEYTDLRKIELLQRLFEKGGSSSGSKKSLGQKFDLMAVKVAYIVRNDGQKPCDASALLKWTPQQQWYRPSQRIISPEQPLARPAPQTIKWQHGKESDYKLCLYAVDRWLSFYSLDVKDKYKTKSEPGNEYTDLEKINWLQAIFEKGGSGAKGKYLGQKFDLMAVKIAYIIRNDGQKPCDANALLKWTPQQQWQKPSQRMEPPQQPIARPRPAPQTINQGSTHSPWRLSMRLADKWESFSVTWDNPLFAAFCDKFADNYARIIERFTEDTGEINRNFLMCAFLAEKAVALIDTADKAYIDHNRNRLLRIDRGYPWRICPISQGGAWAKKEFFHQF